MIAKSMLYFPTAYVLATQRMHMIGTSRLVQHIYGENRKDIDAENIYSLNLLLMCITTLIILNIHIDTRHQTAVDLVP